MEEQPESIIHSFGRASTTIIDNTFSAILQFSSTIAATLEELLILPCHQVYNSLTFNAPIYYNSGFIYFS